MPRIRQLHKHEVGDDIKPIYERLFGDRDPVEQPGTATGTPGDWWTVMANAPDILAHMQAGFALFNSRKRTLDPKLRELGLTRAGYIVGSQFVFSQHCKAARAAGLSEEQIATIPAWQVSGAFEPLERAVLAWTDELILQNGRTRDETFAALKEGLDDVAIIEATYATLSYGLHAAMTKALRMEYDNVEERIVEIAAPTGADQDIMTQISRPAS